MTRWLYRALLRLAPREVRAPYGDDMSETFDALFTAAAARGRLAVARLIAQEAAGVIEAHWTLRREEMIAITRSLLSVSRLRQAARSLVRRPSFAMASLATLAAGTAATTVVFAVVDTVVLKPLPYQQPDRLVTVFESMSSKREKTSLIAPGRIEDWQRMSTTFDAIAGIYSENATDTSGPDPERLNGRRVSPRYFAVMATSPLIGRVFVADEERFGGPGAAVISEGLWTRRFGRAPSAIGTRLLIGGAPFAIVGVLPASFAAASIDVWLPAQAPPFLMGVRDARFLSGVGRMKPGVTIEQAQADLAAVQQKLGEQYPSTDKGWGVVLQGQREARTGDSARTVWIVSGAILLLWLIGLANLAGLAIVQLNRRARELAIRTAIGASRAQVIGVVSLETLLVAVIGGGAGIWIAASLIKLVPATFTALPRMNELQLDARAIGVGAASSLLAALIVGVWPVLGATRGRLAGVLAAGSRGGSARRHFMQRGLVVAQVALSLLLAGSAALLMRSYYNLIKVDAGFSTSGVWTFHVGAQWDEQRAPVGRMQEQILTDLSAAPGVKAAAFVNFLPMSRATLRTQVRVDGVVGPERTGTMAVGTRMITADYPRVLQVPMVAGQSCPPLRTDFAAGQHALVNQQFVTQFANGQNLVGRTLRIDQGANPPYEITGVIGDVSEDDTQGRAVPYVYTCNSAGSWPDPEYVVRTDDAAALPGVLREIVHRHAPSRAIFGLKPLDTVVSALRETPRLNAAMLALFAAAALLLASIGLYSLFMLLVAEQAREIGVRLALGATPGQIVSLVWAGAGRLLALGLLAGLGLFMIAQRLLSAELFGVSAHDPIMLGAAIGVLAAVSIIAIAIPASRAGRVSPMVAMKAD